MTAGANSGGRIDLHVHILAGLDHGAADEAEERAMGLLAAGDGTGVLVATPHVNNEFRNSAEVIRGRAQRLGEALSAQGSPVVVLAGADYLLTPELARDAANILTLGDNGRYFLLEFSPLVVPPGVLDAIKRFLDLGLVPVVTHPERNRQLSRSPDLLEKMVALGCPVQLTAGSLTGIFGQGAETAAVAMLRRGHVQVIASDAHDTVQRPPILSAGVAAAATIVGQAAAEAMVGETPARILAGDPLS